MIRIWSVLLTLSLFISADQPASVAMVLRVKGEATLIDTETAQVLPPETMQALIEQIPLGRLGRPPSGRQRGAHHAGLTRHSLHGYLIAH